MEELPVWIAAVAPPPAAATATAVAVCDAILTTSAHSQSGIGRQQSWRR